MQKYFPIAIVSKAFHFPQGIQCDKQFWEILQNKKCVITHIPQERWPTQELLHPQRSEAGRSVSFSAGVINSAENFDAAFFGISPREAGAIDPQQRLLLMLSQEVLENAGIPARNLAGSDCGVFIGISGQDYGMQHLEDLSSLSLHSMTGNTMSMAANRISYTYDLHGPSLSLDTACSSSLVAVHTACKAIQNGEISCALAGGVNLLYHPYSFVGFSKASMLSPHGLCLPFDAKGAGYVRAEGVAMLFLKPLEEALAQGDCIEAIICGSGVNSDGKRKMGLTIPSMEGQAELMRHVLQQCDIHPQNIDFIEMHGTGTAVGDPIEAQAVSAVYAQNKSTALPISSVKANVGHMEPASGMAGLIKALLVMKNREIPPTPFNFDPHPHIDFKALNIQCIAGENAFKLKEKGSIYAAVNSFGFGGVNAHIILQDPENFIQEQKKPTQSKTIKQKTVQSVTVKPKMVPAITLNSESVPKKVPFTTIPSATPLPPLFLSARSTKSLKNLAKSYAAILQNKDMEELYDLTYCASHHRDFFEKRAAFWDQCPEKLIQSLNAYAEGTANYELSSLCVEQSPLQEPGDIAFIYCGNGCHWLGMAQALLRHTDFATCIKEIDVLTQKYGNFSVWQHLQTSNEQDLDNTAIAQPLIFAIQVAVSHLLQKQGIIPKAVVGHSVGEVAAAHIAGAYDLAQAVRIICARSQCQALTAGTGRMAAIKLTPERMAEIIQDLRLTEHVFLASINAPEQLTLSGSEQHLNDIQEYAQKHQIYFQFLPLNYAFHSAHMDSIKEMLSKKLHHLQPQTTHKAIFVSSVTGTALQGEDLSTDYWWKNVRNPVLFAPAMDTLLDAGVRIFVEIGPHAILQRYIQDCALKKGAHCLILPTLLRHNDQWRRILKTALHVRLAAAQPEVQNYFPYRGKRVTLPNYAWDMQAYTWKKSPEYAPEKRRCHPLLGWSLDGISPIWENILDPHILPWLAHHTLEETMLFPAAAFVEMALAAGKAIFDEKLYTLEFLDIVAPLVFEENRAMIVRTSYEDGILKIVARPRMSDDPWVLHATGRLRAEQNLILPKVISKTFSKNLPPNLFKTHPKTYPEAVQTSSPQSIQYTPEQIYQTVCDLGLAYGKHFQTLQDLHIYSPQPPYSHCLYAQIHVDEHIWQNYRLPPAALDACFHCLVAFIHEQHENISHHMAYLPVKTGAIVQVQEVPITHMAVYVKHISPRSIVIDCALYAKDASLVAYALQCRLQATPLKHKQSSQLKIWHMQAHNKELMRHHAIALPSMEDILEHWPRKNCVNYGEQRKKWFQHTLPLLEMLCLAYGMESLEALQKEDFTAFQKAVQHPYGHWLIHLLEKQELAFFAENHWHLKNQEVPPAQKLWQEIATTAPEAMGLILPMGRIGLHLKKILANPAIHEQFFHECRFGTVSKSLRIHDLNMFPAAQTLIALLQNFIAQTPQEQVVRILEVGAFSWGVAQSLYNTFPGDKFTYTLAATEEEGAQYTQNLLAAHDNAHVFFLQEDWGNASVPAQAPFDIIIVQQCLHNQPHISSALDYLTKHLLAKGLLLITECYEHWFSNFMHGLLPAWWYHQNTGALLSPTQWKAILAKKGFIHVAHKNDQYAEDLQAGAYILLAQKPWESIPEQIPPQIREISGVLLLGDDFAAPLLNPLYKELQAQNIPTKQYFNHDSASYLAKIEDFLKNIPSASGTEKSTASIIFSQGNTQDIAYVSTRLEILRQVLCLLAEKSSPPVRLMVLTQGAVLCSKTNSYHNPASAALWGMGRTAHNEFPELSLTLLDIPYAVPYGAAHTLPHSEPHNLKSQKILQEVLGQKLALRLLQEILYPDGADEILLSENSRQVLLPDEDMSEQQSPVTKETRFKLDITQPGKLTHLHWVEDSISTLQAQLQAQQVEVKVMATGLNFRDVMYSLALLPDDANGTNYTDNVNGINFSNNNVNHTDSVDTGNYNFTKNRSTSPALGLEFSGKVTAIGHNVTQFQVGDAVLGFAPSAFSSHIISHEDMLTPMPEHWRFEEAAGIPTTFFTAYYALKHLAHLQAGETVLIHGGAGGVGLAAIQVAKYLGAEIIATAGSAEKREFLQLLGIKHVFDSRSLDFSAHILNASQGVDVVLNSLSGEAMRRSIGLLRPFGRFIELGKRDFMENTSVHLRLFKENISYFAFDAAHMLSAKPGISKVIFQEIMQLFAQGIFHVLPTRIFEAAYIADAFKTMQQAQHMGKIVVSLRTNPKVCHKKGSVSSWKSSSQETWLITGGFEGLGLTTAQWLAEHGVKSLVLVSRRGAATPQAHNIKKFFEEQNIQLRMEICDVTDNHAVKKLMHSLQQMQPPLKGIIHSAAVYADAFLPQLNQESIEQVIAPKLQGAWNLHKAGLTLPKHSPLEYFVLFSSISASLGTMGQANYAAANAGLESLALLRQSMGLKATCIAWGPIGDVGYLSKHKKIQQNLEKNFGLEILSSQKALQTLEHFLLSEKPVRIATNVHWQIFKHALPRVSTRFTRIFHKTRTTAAYENNIHATKNIRSLLKNLNYDDTLNMVRTILMQELAQVLSLHPQNMERSATLQSLGMDSLMAVELSMGLEQSLGVRLPSILLQDSPTIEKIAGRLMDKIFVAHEKNAIADEQLDLQELAQKHGEILSNEIFEDCHTEKQQIIKNTKGKP